MRTLLTYLYSFLYPVVMPAVALAQDARGEQEGPWLPFWLLGIGFLLGLFALISLNRERRRGRQPR